jgi:cell wall assembly regulator SMI1
MARTKKLKDNSPRFDNEKDYAIGVLKCNAKLDEVPENFSTNPRHLHYSGSYLSSLGINSCNDFLMSSSCYFQPNSTVQFYEVQRRDDSEPYYKNIYAGSPMVQAQPQQQSLSDNKGNAIPSITNIIPTANASEQDKLLYKTQTEQIAYFQKCLQEERKQFNDERTIYTSKQQELNDKILELNLRINTLEAENQLWKMKYEEAQKYMEHLSQLAKPEEEEVAPQGLADRAVGMLDGMLGDGASQQIVMSLATGLGSGLGKLIDFGIDYARQKGVVKPTPQPQVVYQQPPMAMPQMEQQMPPVQPVMMPNAQQLQQMQQCMNLN